MSASLVIVLSVAYLALLFFLAVYIDRKKRGTFLKKWGRWIYGLSLPIYCTAWTFYGSVGKAAVDGWSFLTIYLGPLIMMPLLWLVVRKMIRICKVQNISTLPDLISSRYNSLTLSVLSTLLMVIGIIPYISIQLKAITQSFEFLTGSTEITRFTNAFWSDSAFYLAVALAVFIILFVFRGRETTRQNKGLITIIAVDAIVKLVAFLAIGIFTTYFLFDGFGDIFEQANALGEHSFTELSAVSGFDWLLLLLLSMSAVLLLPRQFQVLVAENSDERHTKTAAWLFPLYLLLINLFVVPVALGGRLLLEGSADPDTYVLALPISFDQPILALLAFLGGFSAAIAMITVSVISLSLMLSNNIILPVFAKREGKLAIGSGMAIRSRQVAVIVIILLAYFYYYYVAGLFPLVSIGLISFAAISQFVPAVIGVLYWKDANRQAVTAGLIAGYLLWFFTLVLPTIVKVGFIEESLLENGLFGLSWLNPQALFGLQMEPVSHGTFWSLLFNVLIFSVVSLAGRQSAKERNMAELYAGIYDYSTQSDEKILWKGELVYKDLVKVSENLLGKSKSLKAQQHYKREFGKPVDVHGQVDARFVNYTQRLLSGVVGSTSARILISSLAKEEEIELGEVVKLLKETTETSLLNSQLRLQSIELKRNTEALLKANERLQGIDKEKDDFISTVTHEMRTPLTAIKAFVEILQDHDDITEEEQRQFLQTINDEIDRMGRLIDQVLDLEKLESGVITINSRPLLAVNIVNSCLEAMRPVFLNKNVNLVSQLGEGAMKARIMGDEDRLKQTFLNLLSNALKYTEPETGKVELMVALDETLWVVTIRDNGRGIRLENQERIFEKFFQARDQARKKPKGTGLGLPITKKIIELHKGTISLQSEWGRGSQFKVTIPLISDSEENF